MSEKIKLVCVHCNAINQFPKDRLGHAPSCGQCKGELLHSGPIEVDGSRLTRHIKHSGLPVLVDFWAPWCGPCQSFAPTYAEYAQRNSTAIRCLKLDTEANQSAGATYNIRSIPTLTIFKDGAEINRISGAMSGPQLDQWVKQSLLA